VLQAFTLMFTLGLVVAGARLLVKSAQPGQSERASLIVIGMLFLAFLIAACAILLRGTVRPPLLHDRALTAVCAAYLQPRIN
jgi:hypothetical protein